MRGALLCVVLAFPIEADAALDRSSVWRQSKQYEATVKFDSWSNFGPNGGCMTCPYTCALPVKGPDGKDLNHSNTKSLINIPDIYKKKQMNGCCHAPKGKSKVVPSCTTSAKPPDAEPCGFLSGPSIHWKISGVANAPKQPLIAILFASTDCNTFWAVGKKHVRQHLGEPSAPIEGTEVINGGCYGDPEGSSIVLAACLTNLLKFDKTSSYSWENLAQGCIGLSGKCSRTNALWGQNLKCCADQVSLDAAWDVVNYRPYHMNGTGGVSLSGIVITIIVIGGVVFLLGVVHCGKRVHDRAKATALLREQEATDDYEEIVTPLNADHGGQPRRLNEPDVQVSLHEGDEIFRPLSEEVLYEGKMS